MGFGLKNLAWAGLSAIPFVGEAFAAQQAQDFSAKQVTQQNAYNANQVEAQMQFQREMSGTAYQRAAEDLEKAGLNRTLALGSPASSPSGSAASGGAASGVSGSGAGSSAKLASSILMAEREKILASIDKDKADTEVAKKQKEVLNHSAVEAEQNAAIRKLQKVSAEKDAEFEKEYGSAKRKADAITNYLQKGASTARDVVDMLRPKQGLGGMPTHGYKTKEAESTWLKPH